LKIPTLECTNCGSNDVRLAHYTSTMERINAFFGFQPFRCRDCRHRFTTSIWLLGTLAYAKCPKCLGLNLVYWSKKHYKPNAYKNFLISMGAQRYRCPGCRCNFVSFRPRKRTTNQDESEQPDTSRESVPVQVDLNDQNRPTTRVEPIPAGIVETPEASAVEKRAV
jgi:transposase-like protein